VICVAWLLGSGVPNAATAGIYTSIAMLILLEIFAGIRIKLTGWALAGQAMVGALLVAGSSWCESSWAIWSRRFQSSGAAPRPGTQPVWPKAVADRANRLDEVGVLLAEAWRRRRRTWTSTVRAPP